MGVRINDVVPQIIRREEVFLVGVTDIPSIDYVR
jgi:hypothetical protein